MFSRRTAWDRSHNRLAESVERKRHAGEPILDLTETNPTQVGLNYPGSELLPPLSDPGALVYHPDPRGLWAARQAVAGVYAERGILVDAQDLFLTASTSEAYAWLFKLLADPGDEILVPQPSYPLFDFLTRLEGVVSVGYPLVLDGTWSVDLATLEARVGSRTRLIVAVNPNNPTGTYLKRQELRDLESLCSRRGIALLGDEVFAEYPHGEDSDRAAGVLECERALTFSLGGLSKLAGLPQMKLGWIAVGGPGPEKQEAKERLELVADTYLSVNTPVQHAVGALLTAARGIRQELRRRTGRNLRHLQGATIQPSPCRLLPCEGGWTAVLQVPAIMSEEDWVLRLLEEDGVLAHPGFFFEFPVPAYLVLSLLPREEIFAEGVARILARAAGPAP